MRVGLLARYGLQTHGPGTPRLPARQGGRALLEAGAACIAKGTRDLLFELSLSGPQLGMLRIYDVIAERSADGSKLSRIAYVDSVPGKESRFAETVASNRGVNVRLFPDVETAERWLSET
jgi:hypothetical protein